jgi:hypothetical protein
MALVASSAARAQNAAETARRELERPMPGAVKACTLITRADVMKATGRDPYVDPEAAGAGGWICNLGQAELKVYSGANSAAAFESTLRNFKLDRIPRAPAPGFGDGAYYMFHKPERRSLSPVGWLVARKGTHTLALSLDAAEGQPAESTRPALEALMRSVLARLK